MIVLDDAVIHTLATALRISLGSWHADFVRDARAATDPRNRLRLRLAKFRLTAARPHPILTSTCQLVAADPEAVATRLQDQLVRSMEDVLTGADRGQLVGQVIELLDQHWPQLCTRVARELVRGDAATMRNGGGKS